MICGNQINLKPKLLHKNCYHLQDFKTDSNSPKSSTKKSIKKNLQKDYANCVRTNGSKNDSARKLQNIKMLNWQPFLWLCVGLIGKLEIPFDKKVAEMAKNEKGQTRDNINGFWKF